MFSHSEIDLLFKKKEGLEEPKYLVFVICKIQHESEV